MYKMEGLEDTMSWTPSLTPYGEPSDSYTIGTLKGVRIAFLARHGKGHRLLPSEVPSRANIHGFKELGVKWLISVSACGSLTEYLKPGDCAVPNGLFDRTNRGDATFFGGGAVAHTSLADPFCPVLGKVLYDAVKKTGKTVHIGTKDKPINLVSINGPRFSTRTESNIFRSWGLHLINMTTVPEAQLACEAEIAYAVINHVTDYDCWHETEEDVSVDAVIKILMANVHAARASIVNAVESIKGSSLKSAKWDALGPALFCKKEMVPAATRKRLSLITKRYWDE